MLAMLLLCIPREASSQTNAMHRFKISLDRTAASDYHAIQILYVDKEEIASQHETITISASYNRLGDFGKGFYINYGLSIADKGYREHLLVIDFSDGSFNRSDKHIRMFYLGISISLAYNLNIYGQTLRGYFETRIIPEVLLSRTQSKYLNYDLNRFGLSYIVAAGIQMRIDGDLYLILSPEIRFPAAAYDTGKRDTPFSITNYKPNITGLTVELQF